MRIRFVSLLEPVLLVLRRCCRRDWERGLGVARGEGEELERKRGRMEEEGVGLGLRLNDILRVSARGPTIDGE